MGAEVLVDVVEVVASADIHARSAGRKGIVRRTLTLERRGRIGDGEVLVDRRLERLHHLQRHLRRAACAYVQWCVVVSACASPYHQVQARGWVRRTSCTG